MSIRISRKLWRAHERVARDCLEHPFVRGLADGSLDPGNYRHFISQDAFFLQGFARAYAAGLSKAPDPSTMRAFLELLNGVFEELELHRRESQKLDIDLNNVTPGSATSAYLAFLTKAAEGTVGEILAAMAPCMRLYAFLGERLGTDTSPDNRYSDWIDTYSSPEFRSLAKRLEDLLDVHGRLDGAEPDLYRQALQLEYEFFGASWEGN